MLMKRLIALFALLVLLLTNTPLAAEGKRPGWVPAGTLEPYVPGEVIVKFRSVSPGANDACVNRVLNVAGGKALPNGAVLLKTADVKEALATLQRDPRVEYAQPNYIYRLAAVNDPLWVQQWGMTHQTLGVQAEAAWDYTRGSSAIKVAVIDSGVDSRHPDLIGRLVPGYDFVNEDDDPADDNGHGTHVAGIIAAAANNGAGIAGAAPGIKIMPLKAADAAGCLTTADVVEAISYAAAHGARVINMSFGSLPNEKEPLEFFDFLLYQAIKSHPDILFVAAAGNERSDNDALPVFPACFAVDNVVAGVRYPALPNVIAVAALGRDGELADFSNWGQRSVHLAAPGEEIVSTVPLREDAGVALTVYDAYRYGYRAVLWGFGAEDLDDMLPGINVAGAVYDAITRTVYGYLGVAPEDTAAKPLLLVDDDQSGVYEDVTLPDVRSIYLNSLTGAGYRCEVYEVPNGGDGPSVSEDAYAAVVWFTGHTCDGDPRTPAWEANLTPADRDNLIAYLREGGRLFLSGRDACLGIERTTFCTDYLDAVFGGESYASQCAVRGIGFPYLGAFYLFTIPNAYFDYLVPGPNGKAAVTLVLEPYEAWSGTSMAAPFVSAGAALALTLKNNLLPEKLINILSDEVTPLDSLRGKMVSGGTLNLANTLRYVYEMRKGGGNGSIRGTAVSEPAGSPVEDTFTVRTAGTVQLIQALNGRVVIELPPGALPEGAVITVRLVNGEPQNALPGVVAASQVYGLDATATLAKPVKVRFRYDPAKVDGFDPRCLLVFRQGADGAWEPVGGKLDRAAGAVVVEIDHFSKFAVFGVKKTFADTAGHWAQKDIELLAAREIIEGTERGVFLPERPVTRAEMAALLVKFKGLDPMTPTTPAFRDVSPSGWYYGAVEAVVRAGLFKGYGDGTFRPDATLTREQLAVIIANMLGKTATAEVTMPFSDIDQVSPWARDAVASVYAWGLMHGVSSERFAPQAEVTRAQAAAIMARLAEKIGLFEVTTAVTGKLVLNTQEKPHWELQAEGGIYVLIPDPLDAAMAALLRAYQGREVTVTGYLLPDSNIYMRGPLLRVLEVILVG